MNADKIFKIKTFIIIILFSLTCAKAFDETSAQEPEFSRPLKNLTVIEGRDAIFECSVNNLGRFKVAFINVDSKMILSIHKNIISRDSRISIEYDNIDTWTLKISNVELSDSGTYGCQVNTDTMMMQTGHLQVVTPPVMSESSSDVLVDEERSTTLTPKNAVALDKIEEEEPTFVSSMSDLTIVQGNDAIFECKIKNIGKYKVAFFNVNDSTVLSIQENIITRNSRVSVKFDGFDTWKLKISNAEVSDSGQYSCTLNTNPMMSEAGNLEVVTPPALITERTSSNIVVRVNGSFRLVCVASGVPKPRIIWRREDGEKIAIRDENGETYVEELEGPLLHFFEIKRSDAGNYMCIAENGVPPSVSTVINVRVFENYHEAQTRHPQVTTPLTTTTAQAPKSSENDSGEEYYEIPKNPSGATSAVVKSSIFVFYAVILIMLVAFVA